MITIRLTEDEFQQIRTIAEAAGAQSVSEFTRSAIHALLSDTSHLPIQQIPDPVERRFATVYARLRSLETRLEQLKEDHEGQ